MATAVCLVSVSNEEPGLAAASNHGRYDNDRDGLTDLQEQVIGTLTYRADTDADGYSDLEECARGSNPLDQTSMPTGEEFCVGTCASQENGFVSIVSAVYLDDRPLSEVSFEVGIVYRGRVVRLSPRAQTFSRAFFYRGHDAQDTLAVVEIGVPEALVQRLGQVSLYSILRSTSAQALDPVVSVMTLENVNGVIVSIEQPPAHATNNGGGATGVVYRPLAADDRLNSTWVGGLMCFQRTSAVGMTGVSVTHEVEAAFCIPMDTYCSHGACGASAGTTVELPDPAALAGG